MTPSSPELPPTEPLAPATTPGPGATAAALPEPGVEFLGFRLLEELGRGAFGRVYLASQDELAGRLVALKVAGDIAAESQALARLQHPNIVPIYSFHRSGSLQAVCMPYLGRTTLAGVFRHLTRRPGLPSSGRELKSTLNRGWADTQGPITTTVTADSGAVPVPVSGPYPVAATLPNGTDCWSRLDGLSYVEAVLWLVSQLAAGLGHAHARGILHRDLKPANVLLSDDGRPMLLDFNLAADTRTGAATDPAAVGGTLPYMAPEHIEAFRTRTGAPDARSEVYALGVMLFEMLAGRHPFPAPRDRPRDLVGWMLADRRRPPLVRKWNRAVSPAAEAIVRKCLAFDPGDRYQSAEHLHEDLVRQLANRPLAHAADPSAAERAGKWVRRHARRASAGAVAAVVGVLLLVAGGAAVYSRDRARDLQARAIFADHRAAVRDAELILTEGRPSRQHDDEALARYRGVLARYHVPEDGGEAWLEAAAVRRLPAADRERLREDIGETFYHMARVAHRAAIRSHEPAERVTQLELAERWRAAAGRFAGTQLPRAVCEQHAALAELRGDAGAAGRLRGEATRVLPGSARDLFLLGAALAESGRHRDALVYLEQSTQADPKDFAAWFARGAAHLHFDQAELAAMCFGACLAVRDDFAPAWLGRGDAFARMRMYDRAAADYDRAVGLVPGLAGVPARLAVVRARLAGNEAGFATGDAASTDPTDGRD